MDPKLATEWQRIESFRPNDEVTIVDRSMDEKVGWA